MCMKVPAIDEEEEEEEEESNLFLQMFTRREPASHEMIYSWHPYEKLRENIT